MYGGIANGKIRPHSKKRLPTNWKFVTIQAVTEPMIMTKVETPDTKMNELTI